MVARCQYPNDLPSLRCLTRLLQFTATGTYFKFIGIQCKSFNNLVALLASYSG